MKILLIDNYDSFTYNLFHYISKIKKNVEVIRNDKIDGKKILRKKYDKIVISPGPGNPNQAGNCLKIVKEDPVRMELSLTPSYGKNPVIVGIVESLDLVARRDRDGKMPRDLQGTWDWTVRHGKVSTGGWNPMLKEALQTMFETGLPAIIYEELTGEEYNPVDGIKHVR